MNNNQIQSSKITLDNLYLTNEQTKLESQHRNSIGQSYSVPYFNHPEKDQEKDPWDYQINKYGFRGKDWTFEKTPAFFGCSCTFGVGVQIPASEILADKLQVECIPNLGIPGGSIVNIIKTFVAFINHHPVSDAFIIIPPISRIFLPGYDNVNNEWLYVNYLSNHMRNPRKYYKSVYKVFTDDITRSYALDYIDWANEVAKTRNIKIHWGTWDKDTHKFLVDSVDSSFMWHDGHPKARDGMHPGIGSHIKVAKQCHQLLQEKCNV